jgi:DUF1680 family protein
MYCAEWKDNDGKTSNIIVTQKTIFTEKYESGLLNGIMTLKANAPTININNNETIETKQSAITLIPYYAWANRGKGEMTVWFPSTIKDIDLITK